MLRLVEELDVARIRAGPAAFDVVDAERVEPFGDSEFVGNRKGDALALRPMLLAVGFKRGELIVENLLGVVEQASDQRRLSVVDAAAGDEAQ